MKEISNESGNLRILTEPVLERLTKGCHVHGYAILYANAENVAAKAGIIEKIREKKYSYLKLFGEEGRRGRQMFIAVFPFDTVTKTYGDRNQFVKDMSSIMKKTGGVIRERGCSNGGELLREIRKYMELYGESGACYIEKSPPAIFVGHARWAAGDLNHIYRE